MKIKLFPLLSLLLKWAYNLLFSYQVFAGIPTILELQKTIERAWQEGTLLYANLCQS